VTNEVLRVGGGSDHIMQKQTLTYVVGAGLALMAGVSAAADTGFYGGVSRREASTESGGLQVGNLPLSWNRFTAPAADDTAQRSMMFGGYRWRSDVAVEATLNTGDKYSLKPLSGVPGGGFGLAAPDALAHAWNADIYTSWEFVRSVSLYGRLGYAQTETRPLFAGASLLPGDVRRPRDGVNYGVGLRYDMSQSLGLRVEYARFGRFTGDASANGLLPESDQLMIGVQFRF
jgi:opacity protein-like surface antigen